MIVAKTVIPNQYWILRKDDRKVGNIEAGPDGFQLKLNDRVQKFNNIDTIKQKVKINFEPMIRMQAEATANEINGFPTTGFPYNAIFDVRHQVPLWTQEDKSKSWFAAGWYRIKLGRHWSVAECPKLITLERYQYKGPFKTKEEAEQK